MTERLRILHCFRAPVGGLFRHVLDLSAEQAVRGHDVGFVVDSTVADPLTEGRLADAARHLTLGIHRIPMGRLPGPRDLATSHKLSTALQAGMIGINHFGVSQPETPFGGVLDSGFGSESGLEGLLAYTEVKLVSVGL